MKMNKLFVAVFFVAMVGLGMSSCGGDDSPAGKTTTQNGGNEGGGNGGGMATDMAGMAMGMAMCGDSGCYRCMVDVSKRLPIG